MLTGELGRNWGPKDSDWRRRAVSLPGGGKEVLLFKTEPQFSPSAD